MKDRKVLIKPVHSPRVSVIQAQRMSQILSKKYKEYCHISIDCHTHPDNDTRVEFWLSIQHVFSDHFDNWSGLWAKYRELMGREEK